MNRRMFLLLTSSLSLAACATTPPPAPVTVAEAAPPVAEAPAVSAHDQLFALFKKSDEDQLRRNPIFGIFRGDLRYADQFGLMKPCASTWS